MVLGALRPWHGSTEFRQLRLFTDPYVLVVGARHPLAKSPAPSEAELANYPWVVPWRETPRRAVIETLFARLPRRPQMVMETNSLAMMSAILEESRCITILSRAQIDTDVTEGWLAILPLLTELASRWVGATTRSDWLPTQVQQRLLTILAQAGRCE